MNNLSLKRLTFLIFLFLIFLLGIASRIDSIKNHFTHVDDVGIAKVLIDSKKNPIIKNIFDKKHENYNNKYKVKIREYFKEDDKILGILRNIFPLASVSYYYSYSPVQFIFTNLFIEFADNYEEIKIYGRLPSLILSILSFIIFFRLGKIFFDSREKYILLFCLSIFYLSWEYIFVSSLMYNYGFGVLAMLIILDNYILSRKYDSDLGYIFSKKKAILLAILFYCSYQVLIPIIAFGFYSILKLLKKNKTLFNKNFIVFFSIVAFLILPGLIWIYLSGFGSISSSSWNSGQNSIFYFQSSNLTNFSYFFTFLIKNFYYVFSRSVSFFPENNLFFNYIFLFLLVLMIAGIINIFFENNENKSNFLIFSFLIFVIWLILVFLNKLTFSPTRHSIILLPLFIIFLGNGFVALSKLLIYLKVKKLNTFIQFFSVIFIILNFTYFYKSITEPRLSLFNENNFLNTLKEYNVSNVIIYDEHFVDMYLMPSLNKNKIIVSNYNVEINEKIKNISLISANEPIYNDSDARLNFMNGTDERWNLIYSKEIFLGGEIEYSNLTTNRPNQFYHYIYSRSLN